MLIGGLHPAEDVAVPLFNRQIGQLAGAACVGEEQVRAAGDTLGGKHIVGCIFRRVGNIDALKAPFIAEDLNLGAPVGWGGSQPDAVVAGHHAQRVIIGHGALKGPEVNLPAGLFCGERGHTVTVHLLVIKAEVLEAGNDTLLSHGSGSVPAHKITEHAVFRKVLAVAPQVGGAVDIGPRSKDHCHIGVHCLFRHEGSPFSGQLQIKGCRLNGLVHIECAGFAAPLHIAALDTAGAVG